MSRLGGLDGLEVALRREVGGSSVGRVVGGAGLLCGGVKFFFPRRESRGDHQGFER